MIVVGASVHNSRDSISVNRIFAVYQGNLVELRQPRTGVKGTWTNHGSPAPNVCIGLPSVALIDNSNPTRQLRVFCPDTNGHLRAARFPAGAPKPLFDDHTAAVAGAPLISTAPGALIVESSFGITHDGHRTILFVQSVTHSMYMGSSTGTLVEHQIVGSAANLIWNDFGVPGSGTGGPTSSVAERPGAPYFAFPNPMATAGVFVTATNGSVFEFVLRGSSAMSWIPHGSPSGAKILSEPHGLIVGANGSVSTFYIGSDSNLYRLTSSTTGKPGVWSSAQSQPTDLAGLTYGLTTPPGALMVVPFSGDVFFRFFVVGTSNTVRTGTPHGGYLVNVPEDHLFEFLADNNNAPNSLWNDHGPGGVSTTVALGFDPPENLSVPRALGQNSNSMVDPESVFVGTAFDRVLEYDLSVDIWTDHATPPSGTSCGPRRFNVGWGGSPDTNIFGL